MTLSSIRPGACLCAPVAIARMQRRIRVHHAAFSDGSSVPEPACGVMARSADANAKRVASVQRLLLVFAARHGVRERPSMYAHRPS